MSEMAMAVGYIMPMLTVLALFWNVARRLGTIEANVKHVRDDHDELRAEMRSLRDFVSVFLDSRRDGR